MNLAWTAAGAAAGLPLGVVLRGVVFELAVPSGSPDQTACPSCGAPVRRLLPLQCGRCKHLLGPSALLELATAVVIGLLLGRFGGHTETVAFAFLGTLGVALAAIDIAVQRLPDRLTVPAYPILLVFLGVPAVLGHDVAAFGRALLGGLALAAAYLLLAVARPGGFGGGDIKLAGLAGLALGWLGWPTLVAGGILGFILFAVVCLALLAARRITLHSEVCFGPFLIGGALLAILASGR